MKAKTDLEKTNQIFLQHLHKWSIQPADGGYHSLLIDRFYKSKTEYTSQIESGLATNYSLQLFIQTFIENHGETNLADSIKHVLKMVNMFQLFQNKNFQDCYSSQLIDYHELYDPGYNNTSYAYMLSAFENESCVNEIKTNTLSFKTAVKNNARTILNNQHLRAEEARKKEAEVRKEDEETKAEQNKLAITHRDKGNTYYLDGNNSMAFKEHLLAWNLGAGFATQYFSGILGTSSKANWDIISLMKYILDEKMTKAEIYDCIMTYSDLEQMILLGACLIKSNILGNRFAKPTPFYHWSAPNDDEIMLRVKNRISLLSEKMKLGTFMLQTMPVLLPEISFIISCYFLQLSGLKLPLVKEQFNGGFFTKTMQLNKPDLKVPLKHPKLY